MNKIKTWQQRKCSSVPSYAYIGMSSENFMEEEIKELREEIERLASALACCRTTMSKASARLRGCGLSNYTIESVMDGLDLCSTAINPTKGVSNE